MNPVSVKPAALTLEGWLAVAVAILGGIGSTGLLSGMDPRISMVVALLSSIALTLQRYMLKSQATDINGMSGEVVQPTLDENTKALTDAIAAALIMQPKP
jgi:hypothetical protein